MRVRQGKVCLVPDSLAAAQIERLIGIIIENWRSAALELRHVASGIGVFGKLPRISGGIEERLCPEGGGAVCESEASCETAVPVILIGIRPVKRPLARHAGAPGIGADHRPQRTFRRWAERTI